jgi:hypothetical protein
MITSNTTINAAPFIGLWITNLLINKGQANISALPFNGTQVLVSPITRKHTALSVELLGDITVALQRKASVTGNLAQLIVSAPSPDRPITIRALFEGVAKPFIITDAYKLAADDQVFGAAFQTIMYSFGNFLVNN